MKIITCTGYGATGSSVVSDLLKEFDVVKSYGDYEFRFISDPHGLRDLEYGLFENNNRCNTDYYIKQFVKYYTFLSKSWHYNYESHFNGKFKEISDKFIKQVVDEKWQGFWHQDIIDETPIRKFFYYLERFIQKKILKQQGVGKDKGAQYYNNVMYYAKPTSKEEFYIKVREYTDKLVANMKFDKSCEFVVLDQLVPADHNETYLNYFSDLKIIVVDRDPRDLFVLNRNQYYFKWIPTEDVKQYCNWFRLLREHQKEEKKSNNVCYLNFEDFIYDYEKTVKKICAFLNIDINTWNRKGEFFNPNISIKNTKKWIDCVEYKKEIEYIEKNLKEFLVKY